MEPLRYSRKWPFFALLTALAPAPGVPQSLLPHDVVLLRRVKTHVSQELARLPDYTCLETIQRSRSGPGGKGGLKPLDTVRVEVLYSGRKELFAAPGARNFRDDNPSAFAAGGLSGTGTFALNLVTIFVDDNAMSTYRGEEDVDGRRAARYDYRVPVTLSGYTIYLPEGSGRVATKGSFWVDAESFDVLRLETHADEIPPSLPLAETSSTVTYARARIGERDVMLPKTAEIYMKTAGGEMSRNRMEFTNCHSFQSESTITFGAPGLPAAPAPASGLPQRPDETALPLAVEGDLTFPAGLTIPIGLVAGLTQDEVVGEQIEGRVLANVISKGAVLVKEGSLVRGRLRGLHRSGDAPGYWVVSLEFSELEIDGRARRFYADLQDLQSTGKVMRRIGGVDSVVKVVLDDPAGVGSFFVKGEKFALPPGLKTVWKTRALQ